MLLALSLIPSAFAGTLDTVTEAIETKVAGGGMTMDYIMPPYDPGVSFSVSITSTAKPSLVNLYGDQSVDGMETREQAIEKMNQDFQSLKSALSNYAKVTRTSISAYPGYNYDTYGNQTKSTYTGYQNVRVELKSANDLETVRTMMTDAGFNSWVDAQLSDDTKISLEYSLAEQISKLLEKKRAVYEKILQYSLGKISSLYVDTWADGSTYDVATGTLTTTTNVSVTYASQK